MSVMIQGSVDITPQGTADFDALIQRCAVSYPAATAQLTQTWHYCQESVADHPHAALLSWHSLELAHLLLILGMPSSSLQAGLLFPLVEVGVLDTQKVLIQLGQGVTQLLRGLLQMEAMDQLNMGQGAASLVKIATIRRMLLAMVEDPRCVMIKLAERLVCLRAVKTSSAEVQLAVAKGCLAIYAPLAHRLGMGQLKWALEDLSLRYLQPERYQSIAQQLQMRRAERERHIERLVAALQTALDQAGIKAVLSGRPKHIYSIWHKMQKKSIAFDRLFDLRAVRIVVESVQTCYVVLGVLHAQYGHLSDQFSDYIARPKANGYQSIHTVVLDTQGNAFEIQIRTQQMHQYSELGVAAHWKYKEGRSAVSDAHHEQRIVWLQRLMAWREAIIEADSETVPALQTQGLNQWVYVFTPKGDVVELPLGATPLDFAYAIHTDIGHRCIGAKVSGRIVPFTYLLSMGDRVEITTRKQPDPHRDWLDPQRGFVKTRRARTKIRHALRKAERAAIQVATITTKSTAVAALSFSPEPPSAKLTVAPARRRIYPFGTVVVEGMDNFMYSIAQCCQPVPGQPIRGFITRGRGISIHRVGCKRLIELQFRAPERLMMVQWSKEALSTACTPSSFHSVQH